MKANLLRMIMPANGAVMVERQWVDNRGHPEVCRIVVWGDAQVAPHFGVEGLEGGDEGNAREGC
jgi:hypothetical protein